MKTTSKETSSESQARATAEIRLGLQQRGGAAHARDDHRHGDRIQQDRQQHVAAARADEHRGEQRPDRGEPDGPRQRAAPISVERCANSGAWNSSATSGTTTASTAHQQHQHAEQLRDVQRRPIDRRQQQRPQRLALPLALERAAERQRAGERDRNPQDAGADRRPAAALPARTRTRTPARTTPRRTPSCRESRGCAARPADPSASRARPLAGSS